MSSDRELEEDLLRVVAARDQLAQLLVVGVALAIAFWKMVGFEVTPTTASSRISFSRKPVSSHSREIESIQTLCPSR